MSEYHIVVRGNKKLMVNGVKFCETIGKMICWVYDWDQAEERGHALSQIYKDGADVSLDTVRAALIPYANNRSANLKGKEWQHDIVAPGSSRIQDV